MTHFSTGLFRSARRYVDAVRTRQRNIRAKRVMRSLPEHLRRDIGWVETGCGVKWR
ncbi:hypothetical protein [Mesorhizobium sp. NBSH29]|uniref:hypothetical protein n=1 Tax=Mesorhizobium sp. NBSH29 TaxID=2654249 RepID=UPI00189663C4|nr:hypothetical protein [Mesorhizobium sp. NBSH29]